MLQRGKVVKCRRAILCTEKIDDWGHDNEKIGNRPLALAWEYENKICPLRKILILTLSFYLS